MSARRLRWRVVAVLVATLAAGCATGEWQHDARVHARLVAGGPELQPAEVADIPPPRHLRPCCAFGTGLHVKVGSMPVPGYDLGNVVAYDQLGHHNYDQGMLPAAVDERGVFRSERNGLLYTCRGGFIDTAHVRDNADRTLYLAAQIGRLRASGGTIALPEEGGERRVVLQPLPATLLRKLGDREVTVRIAEWIAFQLSVWHEIATWYGWSATPLFPETASAFSPEDLYSNLVGIRIAGDVIRQHGASDEVAYNRHMDGATQAALQRLGPLPPEYSIRAIRLVDQVWWNSKAKLPEKHLVLRRNMDLGAQIQPWRLERYIATPELRRLRDELCGGRQPASRLALPHAVGGIEIGKLARLEVVPAPSMAASFPFSDRSRVWVTSDDFPTIIAAIRAQKLRELGPGEDVP